MTTSTKVGDTLDIADAMIASTSPHFERATRFWRWVALMYGGSVGPCVGALVALHSTGPAETGLLVAYSVLFAFVTLHALCWADRLGRLRGVAFEVMTYDEALKEKQRHADLPSPTPN